MGSADDIEKSLNERLDLEMSGSREDVWHGEKVNRLEGYSYGEVSDVANNTTESIQSRLEMLEFYREHKLASSVDAECSALYEDLRTLIDAISKVIAMRDSDE
jgi:hypothetical protein